MQLWWGRAKNGKTISFFFCWRRARMIIIMELFPANDDDKPTTSLKI